MVIPTPTLHNMDRITDNSGFVIAGGTLPCGLPETHMAAFAPHTGDAMHVPVPSLFFNSTDRGKRVNRVFEWKGVVYYHYPYLPTTYGDRHLYALKASDVPHSNSTAAFQLATDQTLAELGAPSLVLLFDRTDRAQTPQDT
jgi:hypothetical protein